MSCSRKGWIGYCVRGFVSCPREGWTVESSTVKENTRIGAIGGVPAKEALMPKSVKSLGKL